MRGSLPLLGPLFIIALTGALWLGILTTPIAWVITIIFALLTAFVWKKTGQKLPTWNWEKKDWLLAPLLVTGALCIWYFLRHPITEAVRSPFELMTPKLWLLIASHIAASITITTLHSAKKYPALSLTLFPLLSFLAWVYPLGFGFDPQLHIAAIRHIVETGSIQPVPVLYGAHYALFAWLSHITTLDIALMERFIVPLLASLVLPKIAKGNLPMLLLAPISLFTFSTPFQLGILSFLLALQSNLSKEKITWSIVSFFTHPITGIAALLSSLIQSKAYKTAFAALSIAPVLLLALAWSKTGQVPVLSMPQLHWLSWPHTTHRAGQDIAATILFLTPFLLAIAALASARHQPEDRSKLVIAGALIATGILASSVPSVDIIWYEQGEYGRRFLLLAALALLPLAGATGNRIAAAVKRAPKPLALLALLCCTIWCTARWYTLFPRRDRQETSRGFNVAMDDIRFAQTVPLEAQQFLLAPQPTAAAIIREQGFKTNLSLPTGAAPYQDFLAIMQNPVMLPRVQSTYTEELVIAIPSYWWDAEKVISALVTSATKKEVFGKLTVLYFQK